VTLRRRATGYSSTPARCPRFGRRSLTPVRRLSGAASFPGPVETFGFVTALALGLQEPVRRTLQTTARLEYAAVVEALEEDAAALASRFARETMERLGTAPPRTPVDTAMWSADPGYREWAAQELERARQLAEFGDVNQLAQEAADFRPDAAG
jgi:hypothetical protein